MGYLSNIMGNIIKTTVCKIGRGFLQIIFKGYDRFMAFLGCINIIGEFYKRFD